MRNFILESTTRWHCNCS